MGDYNTKQMGMESFGMSHSVIWVCRILNKLNEEGVNEWD